MTSLYFLIYFRSVDKSSAHLEIVFIKCINKGVGKPWFKQWYEIKSGSNAGLKIQNLRNRIAWFKYTGFMSTQHRLMNSQNMDIPASWLGPYCKILLLKTIHESQDLRFRKYKTKI